MYSPVMNATEWFFVCHIVHKDEAHGPAVVGGGDGSIPLLPGSVLHTKFKIKTSLLPTYIFEKRKYAKYIAYHIIKLGYQAIIREKRIEM